MYMESVAFEKIRTCTAEGCGSLARHSGLCPTHIVHRDHGIASAASDRSPYPECAVSHCSIPANSRKDGALCDPHYQVKWRGINPEERVIRPNGVKYDKVCAMDDCSRRAVTKSLCRDHYSRARRGQIVVPGSLGVVVNPPCLVDGCERVSHAKSTGLCRAHHDQLRSGRTIADPRVWRKYTQAHPCQIDSCKAPAIAKDLCARHADMRVTYGMSVHELAHVLAADECENPGCTNSVNLCVDHDHSTGAVRGRLCGGCNSALGFLSDNPQRIEGLIAYLARPTLRERLAA